jgi:hypothetical protein
MTAGFSKPIVVYSGYYYRVFYLYLDKNFILYKDSSKFHTHYIYMGRAGISEYEKDQYEREIKKEIIKAGR